MNLLILNGVYGHPPGRSLRYRGTYRTNPSYCADLPADHELNQMFGWYLEEGGQTGVVHDLAKATLFARLCNRYISGRHFEVVEVVIDGNAPSANGILLGFDLCEGYCNSLLQWGLQTFSAGLKLPYPVRVLSELISSHFAPQLNSNGLFQTSEIASSCLRAMTALQNFYPNLYEGGDLSRFKTVAVYVVDS